MPHEWSELVDTASHELRAAVGALWRSPAFTWTAVLTAAVGIGAATAICSLSTALLLHPLPYVDSEQLVHIVEQVPADESPSGMPMVTTSMTYDAFEWRRDRSTTFSAMAAYVTGGATLQIDGAAVRATQTRMTSSIFAMLHVGGQLGRVFADGDADLHTVVLSDRIWRRYFGRERSVIGRQIAIDGTPYTVVAVAPESLEFPSGRTDVWTPYVAAPASPNRIDSVDVVARLRPGVSPAGATREANVIGNAFAGLPAPGEIAPNPPWGMPGVVVCACPDLRCLEPA